jgi:hypothetical protein
MNRPTGIIRTLPTMQPGNAGRENYEASIKGLESGELEGFYIALSQKPKVDVLHVYLLIDGEIKVRLNLAGFEEGLSLKCWDGVTRAPKYWAICTGPVSKPPEQMKRRGFQGFRYTEDLW